MQQDVRFSGIVVPPQETRPAQDYGTKQPLNRYHQYEGPKTKAGPSRFQPYEPRRTMLPRNDLTDGYSPERCMELNLLSGLRSHI